MPSTIPIFRIFDYNKAIEFYCGWLGFRIEWEDKTQHTPVYLEISIEGIVLHLSEHYGDCTPGSHVLVEGFLNLKEFHQKLLDKNYKYMKPGIGPAPWNNKLLCMEVIDPFENRLTFTGEGI